MGILMSLMWCKSLRIWILTVGYEPLCDGGGGNVIEGDRLVRQEMVERVRTVQIVK